MRLDFALRLSYYVTLVLACLCLGYAELPFLSWTMLLIVPVLGLMWLAWRVEGRWTLSSQMANVLAVLIAIGTVAWISFNLTRARAEMLAGGIPWPAGLLPFLGPPLMVL